MAKTKYTVLIPLTYNDGTDVPASELDEIYDYFYVLGGGFTLAGTVTGAYRMKDGSKQVDRSNSLWIVIDEGQEADLRRVVAEICRRLCQEAIYLERSGGTVEFVPPKGTGEAP